MVKVGQADLTCALEAMYGSLGHDDLFYMHYVIYITPCLPGSSKSLF